MQYTVSLPVRAHVKNFILTRYPEEPLKLNKKNKIGKIIYLMIDKAPLKQATYPKYEDKLDIVIGQYYFERKGVYFTPDHVECFNDLMEDEMLDEIFVYLQNLMCNVGLKPYENIYVRILGPEKKYNYIMRPDLYQLIEVDKTIKDFLEKYNLVGTKLTFDALRKAYQRRLRAS